MQDFCSEIGASYSASLTTNGFYLDEAFQASLDALKIKNVQVTFDGDQKEHDLLRKGTNGKGSFETIFSNVISFCNSKSSARLSIRVNAGDANFSSIPGLLEKFPSSVREKTTVFFRWIWQIRLVAFVSLLINNKGLSLSEAWRAIRYRPAAWVANKKPAQ